MEFEILNLKKKGTIKYLKNYLTKDEGIELFKYLRDNIQWTQSELVMYDKIVKTPRFQCVMVSDSQTNNPKVYSDNKIDWDSKILKLKERLEKDLSFKFNYLLLNYYENGQQYISYHADNEVVKDTDLIASVSLGETRKFLVRERNKSDNEEKYDFVLENGDLMVMDGFMQRSYKHSVPKTSKKNIGGRINLTFRLSKN